MQDKTQSTDTQNNKKKNQATDTKIFEFEAVEEIAKKFQIRNNKELYKKHISTGFSQLDQALNGGLTTGIHCLGAISSLGKSTLSLQMADAMAAQGTPVMYVSLEMSKIDLVAKLVSMYTYRLGNKRLAQTSDELTNEENMKHLGKKTWETQEKAAKLVEEHGKNLVILENKLRSFTVEDIETNIELFQKKYQKPPVVFIDYLQILALAPENEKGTEKQNIDYNVRALCQIAAKYKIPIVLISSFNRKNYDGQVSLSAFKDSGIIEYSSDTLFGLQLRRTTKNKKSSDASKENFVRELELVILKQRYGVTNQAITYRFHTKYNFFEEWDAPKNASTEQDTHSTMLPEMALQSTPSDTFAGVKMTPKMKERGILKL